MPEHPVRPGAEPFSAPGGPSGALVLHGAYFDVATGQVFVREGEDYRVIVEAEMAEA